MCLDLARTRTEGYWEVIRLFSEDAAAEKWYGTTRLSSLSTSWQFWKASFIENFGQRDQKLSLLLFIFPFHAAQTLPTPGNELLKTNRRNGLNA